jgi:hypothetical protein
MITLASIALAGCSADLETSDPTAPAAEEEAFELPQACEGWLPLSPGETAPFEVHIEYDEGVEDLRTKGGVGCMRATLAALAEDPPAEPLSLHIGTDVDPADPIPPFEPVLDAEGRREFMAKVRGLMREIEAVGCGDAPSVVRLKIDVDGGTVVSARVDEPAGHPAEPCLVDAAVGREIGVVGEQPLHAIFPVHLGAR